MIRPIDMQIVVNKSQEISNIRQTENNKPNLEQQQFAQEFNTVVNRNSTKVAESEKGEKKSIDKDNKGKNKSGYNKSKRNKKEKNTNNKNNDNSSSSIIDIKI